MLSAALVLGAMAVTAAAVAALGAVVHAPTFFLGWLGAAAGVAVVSARRARERARCFTLGVRLDADAFASADVDLVRRVGRGADYDVGLAPGMLGVVEGGRSPLPIESLTRNGAVRIPLPADGKVRIELGGSSFVVRRTADTPEPVLPRAERVRRHVATARRLLPLAGVGVPAAALLTLLGSVPAAMALGEADMRSSISVRATQWEVELAVRQRAQKQVGTLHRCFDPLPLACQRPGYVGVGVSLAKNGEVRSRWISKSTYGEECPVSRCMANVVAQWYFEPMPDAMKVVIPIQVRRNERPLYQPRPARQVRLADPGDAGALELRAGE